MGGFGTALQVALAPPPSGILSRIVATLGELHRADLTLTAEDLTDEDRLAARIRAAEAMAGIQVLAYELSEATADSWEVDAVTLAAENAEHAERVRVVRWLREHGHAALAAAVEHGEHRR